MFGRNERVSEMVRTQALRVPGRTAVVAGTDRADYTELGRRTTVVAGALRAAGVGRGDLVGVCLYRDGWLLPALLGVLEAGAGYVGLDPAYPPARRELIATDAGLAAVLVSPATAGLEFPGARRVLLDPAAPAPAAGPVAGDPTDPAYVIYTSGSTGRPKGVVVEHRALANLVRWSGTAYTDEERAGMLAAASVCFDASVLETLPVLAHGGTVILADSLLDLPALPARDEVRTIFGVPSVLAELLRSPLPAGVRTVLAGGEAVLRTEGGYVFRGRVDEQVKVRGFRVEPGEVQAVLSAHPAVRHAVVVAERTAAGARLVAYVQAAGPPGPDPVSPTAPPSVAGPVSGGGRPAGGGRWPGEQELRAWVAARVPEQLVPARVLVLERLPLGPTGKVDRAALPAVGSARPAALPYQPPGSPTETLVTEVVAAVLGLAEVGVHDPFAELGGHSLAAARVCAEVGRRIGRPVPLAAFLTAPTPAGLAAVLDAGNDRPTLTADPARTEHQLTATQRELWTLRRLDPTGTVSTVAVRLRLTGGSLDGDQVRAVLDGLVRRHRALRTSVVVRDGEPVAVVRPAAPVPLAEHDATGLTAAARDGLAATAAHHSFDLTADVPLLRGTLLRTGAGQAELVLTADHIAFDGASVGPLLTQLAAALAGEAVPDPELQLADLAAYEQAVAARTADRTAAVDFWRAELAAVPPAGDLPGRRRTVRDTYAGDRVRRPLPAATVHALADLAAARGLTAYAGWLAALGLTVGGHTGRADALVGVAVARRDLPGVATAVGPLVTVLPVGVRYPDDPSFAALAARAGTATTRTLAHVDFPPQDVLPGRTGGAGEMLTPVLLSVQPADVPLTVRRGGVTVDYLGDVHAGGAQSELAVFVTEGVDGAVLQVQYDVARFDRSFAEAFADRLLGVLAAALADPDGPVSRLPLATPAERAALLAAGTGAALPADRPATVVHAIAAQDPDRVAVTGPAGQLTYGELDARSAAAARALVAAGVRVGDTVGVCVPRDHLVPVALLGVLRAGAAYVPLDPDHPADRLAWLAADAGFRTVLAAGAARQVIPGTTVLDLAALPVGDADLPDLDPADLAYVLYTSGSTGVPKGVEVTHANLAAHTAALRADPGLGPDDAVLAMSPLTFDATGIEVWSPLAAGARCVIVERECVLDGHALAARIDRERPTLAFLPPTLLRMLLAAGWTGSDRIRLWCGGELVDPALVGDALGRVAGFWNVYGPTETTTMSTAHRVSTVDGPTVPIGRPLPGETAAVLDPLGRLVPPGVTGELVIGGAGVARGYRDRPDLTKAVFDAGTYRTGDLVRWTAAGELDFVGRRDHQVKVRGQRMELGEVEAALTERPGVGRAAVTVHGTGPDAGLVG